jgi:hypothetical protein
MSHISEIRAKDNAYKRVVFRLTGLSADEYNNLQLDIAKIYLDDMLGDDPMGTDYVYTSKIFWSWFINKWNALDASVIVPALYKTDASFRREKYRLMHINALIVQMNKPTLPCYLKAEASLRIMGLHPKMVELVK